MQHLPAAHAVVGGLVGLDVRHGAALKAPGVVDEQLGVHPEQPEQLFLPRAREGNARHIPHGGHAVLLQPPRDAPAYPPEVGEGAMVPVFLPVAALVQPGHPHAVFVRRAVLCLDVHGHLGQIQVRPDARRGGDAGGLQHLPHRLAGKGLGGHAGAF